MTSNIERRHRDLTETRNRLQKKDRQQFERTCIEFGFNRDWDLVEDGKVIARCSDKERLLEFARRL